MAGKRRSSSCATDAVVPELLAVSGYGSPLPTCYQDKEEEMQADEAEVLLDVALCGLEDACEGFTDCGLFGTGDAVPELSESSGDGSRQWNFRNEDPRWRQESLDSCGSTGVHPDVEDCLYPPSSPSSEQGASRLLYAAPNSPFNLKLDYETVMSAWQEMCGQPLDAEDSFGCPGSPRPFFTPDCFSALEPGSPTTGNPDFADFQAPAVTAAAAANAAAPSSEVDRTPSTLVRAATVECSRRASMGWIPVVKAEPVAVAEPQESAQVATPMAAPTLVKAEVPSATAVACALPSACTTAAVAAAASKAQAQAMAAPARLPHQHSPKRPRRETRSAAAAAAAAKAPQGMDGHDAAAAPENPNSAPAGPTAVATTVGAAAGAVVAGPDGSVSPQAATKAERAAAIARYREKKKRRAFTKVIRYQMRKINAERRPRVKGRFVKRGEADAAPTEAMNIDEAPAVAAVEPAAGVVPAASAAASPMLVALASGGTRKAGRSARGGAGLRAAAAAGAPHQTPLAAALMEMGVEMGPCGSEDDISDAMWADEDDAAALAALL